MLTELDYINKETKPLEVNAVIDKPIKYLENVWGQAIRRDPRARNIETEMSFYPKFGTDALNSGQLPYATLPRSIKKVTSERMIPLDTRMECSRSCWNEALAQSGPFYLRHWQIWDNAPFKPSSGDVSIDPRYGANTRQFTKSFKFQQE